MGTLTVRNIADEALSGFRVLAARRGRSMEAEARTLIEQAGRGIASGVSVQERVARAQAIAREAFGGELPTGVVDELVAERRKAAALGE